ncbi:MAG: TRAP transporter small permease subunit [Rubrimonas sp.]
MVNATAELGSPLATAPERALAAIVHGAEAINRRVGLGVAWLTLGTVLACFATVYTRYALGVNFTWLQEAYIWQHVAVIVLGAGYTMMTGGFVRVDVFYANWTVRRRAMMDLAMTLGVLAPFLWIFAAASWRFFFVSWQIDEASKNPGGLQNLWLLKFTLVAFCALVALQAVALVARCLLVLRGREEFAVREGGHSAGEAV